MIKIAIVEDNRHYNDKIATQVRKIFSDKGIYIELIQYENSSQVYFDIKENIIFDLYLLDIEMPDYNGIELSKEIRKKSVIPVIIFITSHLHYSIDAFELNIFRYIPKSELDQRLNSALDEAIKQISLWNDDYYIILNNCRCEKILFRDIVYLYREGKNTIFTCVDNQSRKERKSLKNVYKDFNKQSFVFVERGYIVNIAHIMKIKNDFLYLRNGEQLHVTKAHIMELKKCVVNYWGDMNARNNNKFI